MNAATDGDTVLVAEGVYHERIVFPIGTRTLASSFLITGDSSAIGATILEPDSTYAPDTLSIIEIRNSAVAANIVGFTLRNGRGINYDTVLSYGTRGGAIFQQQGLLEVEHCEFRSNDSWLGSAIYCELDGQLSIRNCTLQDNSGGQSTILVFHGNLHVSNCHLHHNHVDDGAIITASHGTSAILDSCLIDSNANPIAYLPVVVLMEMDSIMVRGCDFVDNSTRITQSGGGTLALGPGPSIVENCRFVRNEAGSGTALVFLTGGNSHGIVRDCLFEDNQALFFGTQVHCSRYNVRFYFEGCRFIGNRARQWSVMTGTSTILLDHCEFLGNISTEYDSGAAISTPFDTLIATNCTFSGNLPGAVNRYAPSETDYADVRNNYWGHSTGPFHSIYNPQGLGDTLFGDSALLFIPWLTEPPQDAIEPKPPTIPEDFRLSIYPNPFNPSTTISFALPRTLATKLQVFDLLGKLVNEQNLGLLQAGEHKITFNGAHLPSGLYITRLQAGSISKSGKMLLLR